MTTRRQPWLARMSAAYMSFSTARSPNACGMTFVRRRSSPNSRSSKLVANEPPVGARQPQMRDAGRQVIEEARGRARQFALEALNEFLTRELGQHRTHRLVDRDGSRFDLTPQLRRYLRLEVADLMGRDTTDAGSSGRLPRPHGSSQALRR